MASNNIVISQMDLKRAWFTKGHFGSENAFTKMGLR